jgi:hypothetical protein
LYRRNHTALAVPPLNLHIFLLLNLLLQYVVNVSLYGLLRLFRTVSPLELLLELLDSLGLLP